MDTPIKARCEAGASFGTRLSGSSSAGDGEETEEVVGGVVFSARTGAIFGSTFSVFVAGAGAFLAGPTLPNPNPALTAFAASSASSIAAHLTARSRRILLVSRLRLTTNCDLTALIVCFFVSRALCQKISEVVSVEGRRVGRTILKYPTAR